MQSFKIVEIESLRLEVKKINFRSCFLIIKVNVLNY